MYSQAHRETPFHSLPPNRIPARQPFVKRVDPFGVRPLGGECWAKPTTFGVFIPRVHQDGIGGNFARIGTGPDKDRLHTGNQLLGCR